MANMTIKEIMEVQTQLMTAMGWPGGEPPNNEAAAKGHLLAAIHECTEAMNELNWKPWKATKKEVDRDKLTTELMDIIQFIANAALVMGISDQDLENALRMKWVENFKRIKRGEVTNANRSVQEST